MAIWNVFFALNPVMDGRSMCFDDIDSMMLSLYRIFQFFVFSFFDFLCFWDLLF